MTNPKDTKENQEQTILLIYGDREHPDEMIYTSVGQLEYWIARRIEKCSIEPDFAYIVEAVDVKPIVDRINEEAYKAQAKYEKECRKREYEKLKKEFE